MYAREVHLVELFTGETVIVSAGGSELARSEKTTTDQRKGYAKVVRINIPSTAKVIDVEVAETGAKVSVGVEPEHLRYLRVRLNAGALTADAVSEEEHRRNPRGYG